MYPIIQESSQIVVQEGVKNLKFPNIIESSFVSLIVGKPGSGKTFLVEQLLIDDQFYNRKFNYVLFIAPQGFGKFNLTQENSNNQLNISWLIEKINNIKEKNKSNSKPVNLLIIFDDVVTQIHKQGNNELLNQLIFNRRHLIPNGSISIVITTQKYTMCPLTIRNVLTNVIMFGITPKEIDFIKKELIYDGNDIIISLLQNLKVHEFIYIRLNPYLVCHNFKPISKLSLLDQVHSESCQKVQYLSKEVAKVQEQLVQDSQQSANDQIPIQSKSLLCHPKTQTFI